jgi:hypothetical protein
MPRITRLLLVLGASLVCVPPASGAILFEDTFDGTGELNALKWTVTESGAENVVNVGRVSDVAQMSLTINCVRYDYGQAMSVEDWTPPAVGSLDWSAGFRKSSVGADKPMLEPFRFESPAGSISVRLIYGSMQAVLYIFKANGGIGTTAALRDAPVSGNLFEPGTGNNYWQSVEVSLTDSDVSATVSGTTDGTNWTSYSATVEDYTNYFDLEKSRKGNFGMLTEAYTKGGEAQAAEYDDVLLLPEPATAVLIGLGGLIVGLARRRAA